MYSNHINTYNKYVELFKFGIKDYIFKKTYNQKTIFFYYFWRFTKTLEDKFDKKLFNDYHFFVFHKVKFENDLDNLVKLILYTNFDIYFSHLIFPHKPLLLNMMTKVIDVTLRRITLIILITLIQNLCFSSIIKK